jgi:hypothetical protein
MRLLATNAPSNGTVGARVDVAEAHYGQQIVEYVHACFGNLILISCYKAAPARPKMVHPGVMGI